MKKYIAIALAVAAGLNAFTRQSVISDLLAQTEIMQLNDDVEKYPKIIESAYTTFLETVGDSYPTRARYAIAVRTAATQLVQLYNNKRDKLSSIPSYATHSPPALLIGINYQGTEKEQEGAVYDTEHLMDQFLRGKLGYQEDGLTLMTDKEEESPLLPTRDNIERKLATFYRKANEAKEGYFHYSGLGDDGNIEPTDHLDSGSLPGKKLIDDMREHIKKGVQVTLTLDMPTQPLLPNVWNASGEYIQRAAPGKEKGPRIIALSLSEDSEKGRGGLTKALLSTMKDYGYSITYRQLLAGMKSYMEKYGIKQSPQLASSTPLDLDDYFIYNHVRLRPSKAPEPILERKVNKVDGVMTTPPPAKETNKPKLRNNKKNAPTKTKPTPKVVNKSAKIVKPSVTKKSPPKKSPPKKVAVKKKPATTPKKKASPPKKIVKKTPSKSKSRKK